LKIFSVNGGVPSSGPIGSATTGASSQPYSVSWSPDGRFIAVVNNQGNTLQVFSFRGGVLHPNAVITATGLNQPTSVSWSPAGSFIAVVNVTNNTLQIFSFGVSGNLTSLGTVYTGSASAPNSVVWSADGRLIAVANTSGNTLQVFGVNYIVDTTTQALTNSIVFGNSSLGSSYDTNIDFLSESNIRLNGEINFDNVN
jgi:Tol biopolymer transport system component